MFLLISIDNIITDYFSYDVRLNDQNQKSIFGKVKRKNINVVFILYS
jgi:hypothetical protein